jgi:ComF family protein
MVYNWRRYLLDQLFPARCRLCGVTAARDPGLCPECRADLPWLGTACPRCARPLAGGTAGLPCGACQRQAPPFDAATAALRYSQPVDYLVQRLKFSGELALAPLLAELLVRCLAGRAASMPDVLVPVPLHPARLRTRGFNQAGEIARALGRSLRRPVDGRLCRRVRDTGSQSLLPARMRRMNMRGAFRTCGTATDRHIAVVDDVLTSGHTAGELARALRRAGAMRIEIWVIARAGHRGWP